MSEEIIARGERTREEIIQAARLLFIEHGYHGTSMRQIAQKAGIAVGGIYNHFAGKEDIFEAIFLEYHPYFDILPAMNAAQGETVEEFVRDGARRMVAVLGQNLDFLNLMFVELVEFNGQHLSQLFDTFFPQVMEFGQRFASEQEKLRPIPTAVLMRAFLGLFFSYVITELLVVPQMPSEMQKRALDYFVDIFLHGILLES